MNGGALFNAEFGIRHRGSTVPERSGVALSFCRRQWAAWRKRQGDFIRLIDEFTSRKFKIELIEAAKAKAKASPHPFWGCKIEFMRKVRGDALVG
ncbi:hypothetical protein APA99_36165 [Pseudomonas aeruginosa]|nr:hypothetical protein APA99_36165 [Pseudomonas aeruginosa]